MRFPSTRVLIAAGLSVAAAVAAAAGVALWWAARGGSAALPSAGTAAYEQATRAFYHGLAAMEVGLLDDARRQFQTVTQIVPAEPAAWANLALTELRLGEAEAAVAPMGTALDLAPDDHEIALLAARMEAARGQVDGSLAHLRRAVALDTDGLRARFALAEEVERSGQRDADTEAQRWLDELIARAPGNLVLRLERTRLAAKRGDADGLRVAVAALEPLSAAWPEAVMEQYRGLRMAAASAAFPDAVRFTVFLRNVLARVPAFATSLAAVRTPAELIAEPFEAFLALTPVRPTPAPPDLALTFGLEAIGEAPRAGAPISSLIVLPVGPAQALATLGADAATMRRLDGRPGTGGAGVRVAGGPGAGAMAAPALLAVDWNHDFLTDVVAAGARGVRVLVQAADGTFTDRTPAGTGAVQDCPCTAAWAADVEMDGDVDVVLGTTGATSVLRNNGDGTWQRLPVFDGVGGARAFAWGDLDGDADPDAALLDGGGTLHVAANQQGGAFAWSQVPTFDSPLVALTIADLDADGTNDVMALDWFGGVHRVTWTGVRFAAQPIARWDGFAEVAPATLAGIRARLHAADLDNNGALDLVASSATGTMVWLAGEDRSLRALPGRVDAEVLAVADLTGDGRLDLVGLAVGGPNAGRPARLVNRGVLDYHWKAVRPRAQQRAGDQRINAHGLGGQVEVRSGLLWQRQIIMGPVVHFGLGAQTAIDVARIVWPNGVPQAEFEIGVDDTVVAEQRLKGSCPWVFTDDGTGMRFVTDFLWRSPLGLRINAQATAGVTQTEDWVKVRGDQLVARDGAYDVRITAELWETHFFDHVSLMAVDHPAGTEVFVDERFSPTRPQVRQVHTVRPPRAVAGAWDDVGRDVTALVTARDGRHLDTFDRGRYQGIAREHAVEIDLGTDAAQPRFTHLVAVGWVYPTDSSINLAISQGTTVRPQGIALDARDATGRWRVVDPDLGFPAGKNKTMLIHLAGVGDATRVRLRTNLEVYWDWLAVTSPVDGPTRTSRLALSSAELRYRGFSQTTSLRGESPETPDYAALANTTQRWRDLVGYYTRFGDVRELLAGVDDRYVIMNAGDEMRLRFEAPPAPERGWARDFVLVGDGWEKDGDYNTGHSRTVLPLPSHAVSNYGEAASSLELEADPVYQRYRDDWVRFHTRFVSPTVFMDGLGGRRGENEVRSR